MGLSSRSRSRQMTALRRVEVWRGSFRFEHICFRPFRSAVPYWFDHVPVSTPTGSPEAVARLRSGRIEARTRLRMMLTFPRSPLSFRTAGFPRYGWKAGFQMVPSRLPRELKSAPDIRGALASLHPSFVHLVVQQLSRTVSGRWLDRAPPWSGITTSPGVLALARVMLSRAVIT